LGICCPLITTRPAQNYAHRAPLAFHHRERPERLGLIHRDIKPDNIWLESREDPESRDDDADAYRVKILDFGLVRSFSEDTDLTQSGVVVGTPRYMAPEQAQGKQVDQRADLFSLGSVLYHIVSGRTPFGGNAFAVKRIGFLKAAWPANQLQYGG
jgi:serine/threonine protein kinase